MNTKTKTILITLVVAIPAFLLAPMLWPMSSDMGDPTAAQLPFFIVLSVIESLAFGLGIAFIIVVLPKVRALAEPLRTPALRIFWATAWSVASWWPHDNFHKMNGENLQGLLYIEYGFHVTLILSALVIAYSLPKLLDGKQ